MRQAVAPIGGMRTPKRGIKVAQNRWNLLDERLDFVAAAAGKVLPFRVLASVVSAALSAWILGPLFAAVWFSLYLIEEIGVQISTRPVREGLPMSRGQRLVYLGCTIASCLVWCSLAASLWFTGEEGFRLAGMAVLAGLMVHAQSFSFRSPISLAAMGAPPVILWVTLPVVFGGYSGATLMSIGVALLTLLFYVLGSARANLRTSAALNAAEREAVAANEAKTRFLAMVTHELRTPLNGVLGMARALQRTDLDPRQTAHVHTLVRSGDAMLAILDDLLDLSKIEAGQLDLDVAAFDVRDLANHTVDLWAQTAGAKRLELTCEVSPDVPARVMGDETRVRQILTNLVSNALKFTDRGAVRITIAPYAGVDGEGGLELSVADTGIGMAPEQAASLFRPYAQGDASTARRFGGTGLGLSICRQLAVMMGGEIACRSQPGEGSTFSVRLPLPAAAAQDPAADGAEPQLPPLRLLVADDNPINLAVARAVLEAAGAQVETAAHGAEALERLKLGGYDAVLMDVHMPVMGGAEAVGRIRDGQAGSPDIPILALTAEGLAGEEARLRALGFDGLHRKPVRPAELIRGLVAVLERDAEDRKSDAA